MPATPLSPLVRPSCSTSSTTHTPSTPPSPNARAFQQALEVARNSLISLPSPLHPHSTPPGPPDPGSSDSSSDSDSEHNNIFLDEDDNMSTTTALVDVKAGLPEDFSGCSEDARRWILAMSTYVNMCRPQYTSKQMKPILLNKMSKG